MQENTAKTDEQIIVLSMVSKLREQIEITRKLLAFIPIDRLEWQPQQDSFRIGDLLGHLLECLAGFCAALYTLRPNELSHFQNLHNQKVNHFCRIEEAQSRITEYQAYIEEGFALLKDADLALKISILFATEGETVMTVLLGNLEHFINHKYQLFFYLKLLGIPVSTENLYQFRCK